MGTQGTGRKRSTKKERSTAEDDALNLIAREAEARLAAKRAARAEAREIRMKELERQQKELSDDDERMSVGSRGSVRVEDRDYLEKGSRAASALTSATLTSLGGSSSRRGSGETAITVDAETAVREIKEIHELKDQIQDVESKYTQNLKEAKDTLAEVEEKYRKAMVSNAQLDNEKNNLMYQVDTLKDSLMELEELLSESRREHEEKVKDYEREKHAHSVLQFQFYEMKETLKQSEDLLNEIRQLRMKQDSFVREISDLQETVEWKDKKIGALERQKEYTDAIRIERDELREEVVKLKDILKKHGIVLGPDLNINGEVGEAVVDGAPRADPASQTAQDLQTSPAEGNSMLGNTEEAQLRSSREEEVEPEQHQGFSEEAKENDLSSDSLCNVADVSTLDTCSKDKPAEEEQTYLNTEEDNVEENGLSKDLNVDINDSAIAKANTIVCPELQGIVKSSKENGPDTDTPMGGDLEETSRPGLGETETKCSSYDTHNDDIKESSNKMIEEKERKLENAESCPQQIGAQDVIKEHLIEESVLTPSNKEPQQDPEIAEEAENDEEEETPSKSQPQGASGKKKKRKRRGKKKGGAHEDKNQQKDSTEKEKANTKKELVTMVEPDNDGSITETLKESKVDPDKNEPELKEPDEIHGLEAAKPTDAFSHNETLQESRDDVTDKHEEEQTSQVHNLLEVESVAGIATFSSNDASKEISVDHIADEQIKVQCLESEIVDTVTPTEMLSRENFEESITDPEVDEKLTQQTSESEKEVVGSLVTPVPETSFSTSDPFDTSEGVESADVLDTLCAPCADESKSGTDISTNVIHTESETVDGAEDDSRSTDDTKSEHITNIPEKILKTNDKENTDAELRSSSHEDAVESEIPNNTERTDDFTNGLKSLSGLEPPLDSAAMNSASDDNPIMVPERTPEDASEAVKENKSEGETKEEFSLPSVIRLSSEGDDSELLRDRTTEEELNEDLRESEGFVEPDSSSQDDKSEISDSASLKKHIVALEDEKLVDGKSQTVHCEDQTDNSNAEVSCETEELLPIDTSNAPDSQTGATQIMSTIEQDSTEELGVTEDPEQKSRNDQQSETHLCASEEQPDETCKEKTEDNDPAQPNLQECDEEDMEEDEGLSFDFDDMDLEVAIETDLPNDPELEGIEEGVEVQSDESNNYSLGPCQSNTDLNENTQDKPVDSTDHKCSVDGGNQVDTLEKDSGTLTEGNQNSLGNEEGMYEKDVNVHEKSEDMPEEVEEEEDDEEGVGIADEARPVIVEEEIKVLNVGELEAAAENVHRVMSSLEEGLDVVKQELQGEGVVLPKSTDHVASSQVPQQAGKGVKKNGKKGKGKEDCKMS